MASTEETVACLLKICIQGIPKAWAFLRQHNACLYLRVQVFADSPKDEGRLRTPWLGIWFGERLPRAAQPLQQARNRLKSAPKLVARRIAHPHIINTCFGQCILAEAGPLPCTHPRSVKAPWRQAKPSQQLAPTSPTTATHSAPFQPLEYVVCRQQIRVSTSDSNVKT